MAITNDSGRSGFKQLHKWASNRELQRIFVAYHHWARFNSIGKHLARIKFNTTSSEVNRPTLLKIALSALKNWHLEWSNEHLNARPLTCTLSTEMTSATAHPRRTSDLHIQRHGVHQIGYTLIFSFIRISICIIARFRKQAVTNVCLSCQIANSKLCKKMCQNAVFGKVSGVASGEVTVELFKVKCLPVPLYTV